jgi:heme-degrading monooxygenase HmoA
MIVTVFRSRLRADALDEYAVVATRMSELAQSMPGYISHKTFTAPDGERCTIAEFEDEESTRAWSTHMEHQAAKLRGREAFYSEYDIKVCAVQRAHKFPKAT